ncbi:hypothetical protein [Emticicia soli]|uniref:Uncharacterized protein n=1 Tax=Emticicia soli TaxID=2027878 RepID=A0ABW5J4L9_9BACT
MDNNLRTIVLEELKTNGINYSSITFDEISNTLFVNDVKIVNSKILDDFNRNLFSNGLNVVHLLDESQIDDSNNAIIGFSIRKK